MSEEDTFLLAVSEICLKLLTIELLLILSNTSIVLAYYSICLYVFRSFYLRLVIYHKMVILCTSLLIIKTFLFIYFFTKSSGFIA